MLCSHLVQIKGADVVLFSTPECERLASLCFLASVASGHVLCWYALPSCPPTPPHAVQTTSASRPPSRTPLTGAPRAPACGSASSCRRWGLPEAPRLVRQSPHDGPHVPGLPQGDARVTVTPLILSAVAPGAQLARRWCCTPRSRTGAGPSTRPPPRALCSPTPSQSPLTRPRAASSTRCAAARRAWCLTHMWRG